MSAEPFDMAMSGAALGTVWALSQRARQAATDRELGFLLVNDTLALAPYRQAVLWLAAEGTYSLSGVVQIEANAPYVLWSEALSDHLLSQLSGQEATAWAFTSQDLPPALAQDWGQWWPGHALWLGLGPQDGQGSGGLLLLRDEPWNAQELAMLSEWTAAWWHAFEAKHRPRLRSRLNPFASGQNRHAQRAWWQRRSLWLSALVLAVLACPVRLSVLAPGELVPANPVIMRAPVDGVIDVFHVQPNQTVQAGQPLFGFDEVVIQARLDVAVQALSTASTDYRQTAQMALTEAKWRNQLPLLVGKVEEKRAEVAYLRQQLKRSRVLAPQAGVVLMDDSAEWIGKPVSVGERILRIAVLDDAEIEAWLPLADAIDLQVGAPVKLYLSANPLEPVNAQLRYVAHEAVQRPDGLFAFRVRAALTDPTTHRVGLKGTAKLEGEWTFLAYWIMRRPWATLRMSLGL